MTLMRTRTKIFNRNKNSPSENLVGGKKSLNHEFNVINRFESKHWRIINLSTIHRVHHKTAWHYVVVATCLPSSYVELRQLNLLHVLCSKYDDVTLCCGCLKDFFCYFL